MESVNAGPTASSIDEMSCDRIGCRINELIENRSAVDEVDNADLLARPEVFPSSPTRVEALRKHLVEVLREEREIALRVVQYDVMMIGHRDCENDLYLATRCSLGKAVYERVIGVTIGSK